MQRREFLGAAGGLALCACDRGSEMEQAVLPTARKMLQTAFGRISYLERGEGNAALFLHGFPLNSFQWRGAIERLSSERRCLAPDFLGLGYTEVAAGQSLAPAEQARMLVAFLDGLGVGAVDVIANDSGGAVAQLLAVGYPHRVRTMLLTNCDVEFDSPPPALLPVIELAHAGRYAREWLVPWLNDKALARSAEGLGGMCFSRPGQPTDEALDCYLRPLVASPAREALTNAYAISLEHNALAGIEAQLNQCAAPTRIIWGMADPIFSRESPDYLQRILPNARGVRRLEAAKLFFPEEYPDVIAEEALRIWRG